MDSAGVVGLLEVGCAGVGIAVAAAAAVVPLLGIAGAQRVLTECDMAVSSVHHGSVIWEQVEASPADTVVVVHLLGKPVGDLDRNLQTVYIATVGGE